MVGRRKVIASRTGGRFRPYRAATHVSASSRVLNTWTTSPAALTARNAYLGFFGGWPRADRLMVRDGEDALPHHEGFRAVGLRTNPE
jgi:hypothetical protein